MKNGHGMKCTYAYNNGPSGEKYRLPSESQVLIHTRWLTWGLGPAAAWHTRGLWKHVGIPLVCSILPSPGLMTKPTKSLITYLSVTLTAHSRHSNTGLALSGTVYPRSHEGGYEELSSRNPSEQFAKALI